MDDAVDEGVVRGVSEQVRRLAGVLRVAQRHAAVVEEGYLEAVGPAAALAVRKPVATGTPQ